MPSTVRGPGIRNSARSTVWARPSRTASAVVGLSLGREQRTFSDLPLEGALAARGAEARCGLLVIDTATGDTVAWARIEGVVRELFDVAILPGVRRPALVGLRGDDVRRVVSLEA